MSRDSQALDDYGARLQVARYRGCTEKVLRFGGTRCLPAAFFCADESTGGDVVDLSTQ